MLKDSPYLKFQRVLQISNLGHILISLLSYETATSKQKNVPLVFSLTLVLVDVAGADVASDSVACLRPRRWLDQSDTVRSWALA